MVDIIRRKNVNLQSPDVSSGAKATANAVRTIGSGIGSAMQKYGARLEREQEKTDKEYTAEVQQNLKEAQTRLISEQKAFDASDKIVAADRIGRLKNDLLRWNLAQRENNPNYIGTPEHERAMRDEFARLSNKYGSGLGEAGRAEFTDKTQSAVNDFIGNDVKWAYQQKLKQGEESAKQIAETMNKTAGMYGANGDVDGFKESHKESRDKLKEYIENTAPAGASPALYELDKKSLVDFYTNLAQTDPVKAKALLDSMENFKETVPDDMLQGVNDIVSESVNRGLNEKRILLNAGIENSKKGTPQRRELEKQKKQLEKDIKKAQEQDYSEQSLGQIHKEVSDAVKPVLEKSLGESALIAKKEHEEEKVARFGEFLKLPTPENLKFFEEDNQMSYAKPEKNMSELPEDMKTQTQKNNELLENMMKYRENFGNVSMVEISDYKGTKQMFDDLNNLAQCKIDEDGNCNEILNGALTTLNNAKEHNVSEADYNNLQNITNNVINNPDYKAQTQYTMALAKANILDHYADLFSTEIPETDKELQKPEHTTLIATGVFRDWKTKKVADFQYASASPVNRAKYNLVKDTYLSVMGYMSAGDFEKANNEIFALPYRVATFNYDKKISPELIEKFMQHDKTGGKPVEFMYNGYSFEYLGIDPTGTIKAKRRL